MKHATLWLLFSLLPFQAFGWGGVGHRTVAIIAEANLSKDAKLAAQKLLGKDSISQAAVWADSIKSSKQYPQTTWYHFEKIEDHVSYLDNLRTMPDWQKQKGGLVGAMLLANSILIDGSLADRQLDALRFLIHFTGDIHQPLHTGRPADKGGLTIRLNWFGTPLNLHQVWDSGMIRTGHPDVFLELTSEDFIARRYADLLMKRYADLPVSTDLDIEGWLNESLALRAAAYDPSFETDQVNYQNTQLPVIDRRIYEAGIRLAAMLNRAFSQTALPGKEKALWNDIETVVGDLTKWISFSP